MSAPIPFTVIGGFLGAGKTTLLNYLLGGGERRYAVLVNDFGALNIDRRLIRSHGGRTMALENGCICCSLADGLTRALLTLTAMPDAFDHIVVEASGVADPAPIADVALADPDLAPDGVLVLVDAVEGARLLDDARVGDMVRRQIEAADLLALNKSDLADAAARAALKARLRALNPTALLIETAQAMLPMPLAFGHAGPTPGRKGAERRTEKPAVDPGFQSRVLAAPVGWTRAALRASLTALPANVMRAKGFVRLKGRDGDGGEGGGEESVCLVQMTGRRIDFAPAAATESPGLVLIGVGEMPECLPECPPGDAAP